MNSIREIEKINQEELERGIAGTPASWHSQFQNSPWLFVGNLDHELTEGDILAVFSQFGEVEDINLAREDDTGKSKGFAFLKYEDSRSCILAVDNFVGVKVCGRPMRVDHVEKYRLPKTLLEEEEAKEARNFGAGHAYQNIELANKYSIEKGQDLFAPRDRETSEEEQDSRDDHRQKRKKHKKKRRKDERRVRKEEKRRQKRARKYSKDDSIGSSMDDEDTKEKKRRKRSRQN